MSDWADFDYIYYEWNFAKRVYVMKFCKIWGFYGGDYEECSSKDLALCGSCKNSFRGTYGLHYQGGRNKMAENNANAAKKL
jgi:hypothetical protein